MSTHILSAEEAGQLGFPRMRAEVAGAGAIAAARDAARMVIGGGLRPERLDDALLAISELLANSLLHAGGGVVTVWAGVDAVRLRVEVHDDGSGIPDHVAWAAPDPGRPTGRGLALVALITDRCGHRRSPWAMTWFELDLERRRPGG
jgi:anti-sigma regulatory factor (Ser/Thr protein kinase)